MSDDVMELCNSADESEKNSEDCEDPEQTIKVLNEVHYDIGFLLMKVTKDNLELEKRNEELKRELKSANTSLESECTSRDSLERQLDNLNRELQLEKDKSKDRKRKDADTIGTQLRIISDLKKQVSDLEERNRMLSSENASLSTASTGWKRDYDKTKSELVASYKTMKEKGEKFDAELKSMKDDRDSARQLSDNTNEKWDKHAESLKISLQNAQKEISEKEEKIERLQDDVQSAKNILESKAIEIQKIKDENTRLMALQSNKSPLSSPSSPSTSTFDLPSKSAPNASALKKRKLAIDEKEKIQKNSEFNMNEVFQRSATFREMNAKMEKLEAKNVKLTDDVQALNNKLEEYGKLNNELKQKNKKYKEAEETWKKTHKDLITDRSAMKEKLKQAESKEEVLVRNAKTAAYFELNESYKGQISKLTEERDSALERENELKEDMSHMVSGEQLVGVQKNFDNVKNLYKQVRNELCEQRTECERLIQEIGVAAQKYEKNRMSLTDTFSALMPSVVSVVERGVEVTRKFEGTLKEGPREIGVAIGTIEFRRLEDEMMRLKENEVYYLEETASKQAAADDLEVRVNELLKEIENKRLELIETRSRADYFEHRLQQINLLSGQPTETFEVQQQQQRH